MNVRVNVRIFKITRTPIKVGVRTYKCLKRQVKSNIVSINRVMAPEKSLIIHLQVPFPLFHSSHWQ